MPYVDVAVIPVPNANKSGYIDLAEKMAQAAKNNGALQVTENWSVDAPDGQETSFPTAVKLKEDESIVVSWIIWPSKEVRDQAWAVMMQDPAFQPPAGLFDGKRMIHASFEQVISLN